MEGGEGGRPTRGPSKAELFPQLLKAVAHVYHQ